MNIQLRHEVHSLARALVGRGDTGALRARLTRHATGTFVLNTTLTGLLFVTSVVLARVLGAAQYGAYSYALTWVAVLGIPAGLGLSLMLIREVAAYRTRGDWSSMHGITSWSLQAVLLASVAVATLSSVAAWLLRSRLEPGFLPTLLVALWLLPVTAILRTLQSFLRGIDRVVLGQLAESLVQPLLFLLAILALFVVLQRGASSLAAMELYLFTAAIALLVALFLWIRYLPGEVRKVAGKREARRWLASAFPLMIMGALFTLNSRTDAIVLGIKLGTEPVGIYSMAVRGAELLMIVQVPVLRAMEPSIAGLYAAGQHAQLQRLVTRSTRITLALTLPLALALIFFGRWFLLIFGPEFVAGQAALIILCCGQLVNMAAGPVATLLIMTGHERDVMIGVAISGALNLILNPILIGIWGLNGAAMATAISMTVWNLLMVAWVRNRLAIDPIVLGRLGRYR